MSSHPKTQTTSDLTAIADALRSHDRFVVTTHENPDGDALGSLLAAHLALKQLGKDSVMVLANDAPLPGEYGFMALGDLKRAWPDDLTERVLVAVDCAQENRMGQPAAITVAPVVVDVDHHHDNTRFGAVTPVGSAAP